MTIPRRLLVIGLDGFEISLAESMMAEGLLPNMARARAQSHCVDLDQGRAKESGLSWEQFCSGRAPDTGGRWSAVTFDAARYAAEQKPTSLRPVFAHLSARTVVFDVPYFDLDTASGVQGVANWGAHDPGVGSRDRPGGLFAELTERFGDYRAKEWIYGFSWPSVSRTETAVAALTAAVHQRAEAAAFLLSQRLPDWDLAIVTVGECHSAIEQLWHGIDPSHPLHGVPSAETARTGLRAIYGAIDDLIGRLADASPDARLVIFTMHGMGTNNADVAAMALLPEVLFRLEFGRPHFRERAFASRLRSGIPLIEPNEDWGRVMSEIVVRPEGPPESTSPWGRLVDRLRPNRPVPVGLLAEKTRLEWQPGARYQPFWSRMRMFALPAFYDGQIRVNLIGRESHGRVRPQAYPAAVASIERTLRELRDAVTGEPAVENTWSHDRDPLRRRPDEADLYVEWHGVPLGIVHPKVGTIGPLPMRRTGGHTGKRGFAWFGRAGTPGHFGWRSAFDVVPTIFALLGETAPPETSGRPIEVS